MGDLTLTAVTRTQGSPVAAEDLFPDSTHHLTA